MVLLDPVKVKRVVLHTSASPFGDVELINKWHKERGWAGIGYHHLITGIYPTAESYKLHQPELASDGLIHAGRNEIWKGAHVRGHNWETVGICLIGKEGNFTSKQLLSSAKLCTQIMERFPNCLGVKGHCEFTDLKSCPDLDMNFYRSWILQFGREDA